MDVVLIPAYEPDAQLIRVVDELFDRGFKIVVVNDGSGDQYDSIFAAVSQKADVVAYDKNRGKGAALKAGMVYIRDELPACNYFITCDADGQHLPCDVDRVRKSLYAGNDFVLTVRQRKGKIPLRSRFGNDLSRVVYTLLTDRYLPDNQSGLRGFTRKNLDWLISVPKNNYDYEMNVLYYAAKMGVKIKTLPIDAIYIQDNASSHFRPVADTVRIYKSLFSLARGTLFSIVIAEIFLLVMELFYSDLCMVMLIPAAGALALGVRLAFDRFFLFRSFSGYHFWQTIRNTVVHYAVYTALCLLLDCLLPAVPVFVSFNIVYLVCKIARFFLYLLLYKVTHKK